MKVYLGILMKTNREQILGVGGQGAGAEVPYDASVEDRTSDAGKGAK